MPIPIANERKSIMEKIGVVTVIAVVGAFGVCCFKVGLMSGEAHKTWERNRAFNEGFEKGKSCKTGALGVPLGTKCEVFGWLDRPSPPLTKRDDADNIFYLDIHSVNGRECRVSLRVLLNKDEAARFCKRHEFVGYESIEAEGVPAWCNEGRVAATDYFVEHYFVITDALCNGTATERSNP